jgi:hypothetical protein
VERKADVGLTQRSRRTAVNQRIRGQGAGGVDPGPGVGAEPGEGELGAEPLGLLGWFPSSFGALFALAIQRCLAFRCFLLFPENFRLHFLIWLSTLEAIGPDMSFVAPKVTPVAPAIPTPTRATSSTARGPRVASCSLRMARLETLTCKRQSELRFFRHPRMSRHSPCHCGSLARLWKASDTLR